MVFWCLLFPPKKNKNKSTWGIILVKSNSFVHFFEEIEDTKNPFEIIWPLQISYYVHIPTGKDKIFLPDMQIAGIPGTLLSDGIDSAFSFHVLDKMDKNKLRKVETEHRQS